MTWTPVCIQNNKPCVWFERHGDNIFGCHLPKFMWILNSLKFGGTTDRCNTYMTLEEIDGDWIEWLIKRRKMSKDVTYLYNKICPHCGKIISEVRDSPHPQPCPFCREYFVIGGLSQLEKMEERSPK